MIIERKKKIIPKSVPKLELPQNNQKGVKKMKNFKKEKKIEEPQDDELEFGSETLR